MWRFHSYMAAVVLPASTKGFRRNYFSSVSARVVSTPKFLQRVYFVPVWGEQHQRPSEVW